MSLAVPERPEEQSVPNQEVTPTRAELEKEAQERERQRGRTILWHYRWTYWVFLGLMVLARLMLTGGSLYFIQKALPARSPVLEFCAALFFVYIWTEAASLFLRWSRYRQVARG